MNILTKGIISWIALYFLYLGVIKYSEQNLLLYVAISLLVWILPAALKALEIMVTFVYIVIRITFLKI